MFIRYYWRKSTAFQGIPLTKVSRKWSRINHVDAAAEVPYKDMVYFFEGDFSHISFLTVQESVQPIDIYMCPSTDNNYWAIRAYAKTIMPGYPKRLTNLGLPSSVRKVDAAVYLQSTRKTLIFVKNQYYRLVFFSSGII